MLNIVKEGVILNKTDHEFENEGVLNPAVMQEGDIVHVFYRAVRQGNHSTIGYCQMNGPLEVAERGLAPLLAPEVDSESQGVEDARIVRIDDLYYLTFTAYDGINALGALATSTDLVEFQRMGIIVPQITHEEFLKVTAGTHISRKYNRFHNLHEPDSIRQHNILLSDKNLMFFPRKINGKFYFLHRIRPDIQIASVNAIEELTADYWNDYLLHFDEHILMTSIHEHEISYIGGGCPPIETKAGWLLIYHGVHDTAEGYVYSACAALLDLNEPEKELARLPFPLFKPELDWELKGEVNNVVFPTGTSLFDGRLYIYYGAADTCIAVASVNMSELITELLNHKR
ncbi:glycoside hydrolase family 130 protein [Reichenbachiella ulvae]|uniref:Pesticidal protein Cry7Aa n=1 Tax=Reichenbachiella ulvae TaxID=2980104 RepID=A0ABT3CQP0_9BACT|nr:hypothetical protein [Reichenbachiella ulvae]MCV9385977.1 hypothetical protein [Reichenbachiella ulvae]